MREKLIELVNSVLFSLPWGEISSHTAEDVADRLIDRRKENDYEKELRHLCIR